MNIIFKNKKVELTGLVAWGLLSFAMINISIQLFHQVLLAVLIASFISCFLNSFFLLAFYKFKLSINCLWSFTLMNTSIILIFQSLFDFMVRLNGPIGGLLGYFIIGFLSIFWNMVIGSTIRAIANVKK